MRSFLPPSACLVPSKTSACLVPSKTSAFSVPGYPSFLQKLAAVTYSQRHHLHLSAERTRKMVATTTLNVFDTSAKLLQRKRAALQKDSHVYDYVKDEVGLRLAERVYEIKRDFRTILDLGCGRGHVTRHLDGGEHLERVTLLDSCEDWLKEAVVNDEIRPSQIDRKCCSLEDPLPFKEDSVELITTNLALHWVNNLPGLFQEIKRVLTPDGVFLGTVFGGETLFELRTSLQLAELEREGGFAAHVSPFAEGTDLGNLMQNAGFILLTIDSDEIRVNYPSIFELMWDLQGMGENNATWNRRAHLPRNTIIAASAIYKELFGNSDGTVPATFHILSMIGWKPDPANPVRVAPRGSQDASFSEVGNVQEILRQIEAKQKELDDQLNKKK
ncbi:unnamed protein product [Cyprideis torosa]|uniref:Arginine-hydroxylase NDUFAF5, mitochondrial n=1 Tax=Cyprideis torosa TaxID=163714 RepID=A0A7R8WGK9_9CRUS|nr:unnamed protein product [Cyprideis torosa]CAG0893102.1 unnamed protein product [Cyprideis torosa]